MEEHKYWLEQAEHDLRKAEILFNNSEYDGASFYSQQTVEKVLKGIILKNERELIKIHDLVILGRMAKIDKNLLNGCKKLSLVYSASRYGILGDKIPAKIFNKQNSSEYIKLAKEVLKWAKKEM